MADTVSSITSRRVEYQIEDEFARETKLDRDELPAVVSAFENDAGYITKAVSDLTNYYTRSEVYTREEVDLKLSTKWTTKVVESLPTEGISESTIYFVPIPPSEQGDVSKGGDYYSEYIHVDGVWEMIGNTHVDLSDYYTKSDVDSLVEQGVAAERDARAEADSDIMDMIETTNQNLADEAVSRGVEDSAIRQVVGEVQAGLLEEASRASAAETGLGVRMESAEVHVANRQNPHEVTAEQVGLGNVTNVATTDTLIENSEQNITSGAVYSALEGKVDKQEGRGLSDENFTIEEKLKLEGLENYDDTEVRADVDDNKSAIETLNGDADVEGSVENRIANALQDVTSLRLEIVKVLPEEGENGVIYFLPVGEGEGVDGNVYAEYVWMGGSYEKIGTSTADVNLTDYYTKGQVDALVSVKADKDYVDDELEGKADKNIISDAPTADPADANYVAGAKADGTVTKTLWSKVWDWVKGKIQGNNFEKTTSSTLGWFKVLGTGTSGDLYPVASEIDENNRIFFGIGAGRENRGIFACDDADKKYWLIRSGKDGKAYIDAPNGFRPVNGILESPANGTRRIFLEFSGTGLTADTFTHIAAFKVDFPGSGACTIRDMPIAEVKKALNHVTSVSYNLVDSQVDIESNLNNLPINTAFRIVTHEGYNGSVYVFYAGGSRSGLAFQLVGGIGETERATAKMLTCLNSSNKRWFDHGRILTEKFVKIPTLLPSTLEDGMIWIS